MKHRFFYAALCFSLFSSFTAAEKLRIGTIPTTVGVPVQYAFEQGYFKDEGLDVEVIVFSTGAPVNEALAAKKIDVAASGLASVFPLAIGSSKWIGEINTTGGQGMYVRQHSKILTAKGRLANLPNVYGSPETVTGSTVLTSVGTTTQFMAVRYAQKFGLKEGRDVKLSHMDFGPSTQAFKAGQGDILSMIPPYTFEVEAAGFVKIASFEDITGVRLYDGLLAHNDVLAKRRDEVVKFVRAVYRADDALQDPKVRAQFSMVWFAKNGRPYTEKIMSEEMAVRDYITKPFMAKTDFLYGQGMIEIAKFFAETGKIEKDNLPNVARALDASVLKDAIGISVKVAK